MNKTLFFLLLLSLTLGLAPFSPEPHIIGKIRWIAGGGDGMSFIDYLDLLLHGAPWLMLSGYIGCGIYRKLSKERDS